MRKHILFMILLVVVLTGCLPEETEPSAVIPTPDQQVSNDPKNEEEPAQKWFPYKAKPETFYQTYGWLSDSEILIAEVEEGTYILRSYNVRTGEKQDIYQEPMMVINTKIHSSQEYIALHVSESSATAIIKIISQDGTLIGEVKVDSSEVHMDWNDEDASLMMITAFYEDWSFDSFVYDLDTQELTLVESPDPFAKWLDAETLLSLEWSDHALSGGQIIKIDWKSGETHLTEMTDVVFFDAYGGQLLTVQPKESDEEMLYTIYGKEGATIAEWSAPALSNYSQWFIPDVQWLVDGSMITLLPVHNGLIDEMTPEYQFVNVLNGEVNTFEEHVQEAAFSCTPDGTLCLSGYEFDQIIQFDPFQKWKWLEV